MRAALALIVAVHRPCIGVWNVAGSTSNVRVHRIPWPVRFYDHLSEFNKFEGISSNLFTGERERGRIGSGAR